MEQSYTFNCARLWKLLIDRKMKKKNLMAPAGLSANITPKMGRGESVNIETLARICMARRGGLSDVVDIDIKAV